MVSSTEAQTASSSPQEANHKIIIEGLSVGYSDGTESLKDVSLVVPNHAITVLFGPAGGGKSTLLRTINRLNDLADVVRLSGHVWLDGVDILDPSIDVISLRRRVGIVFTQPVVLPMTIRQNLTYGLELAGERSRKQLEKAVEQSLRAAALWEEVSDRLDAPAAALSGGQQQRVGVARALAADPDYLLMDEPFGALDALTRDILQQELLSLKARLKKTIIFVTHDIFEALTLGDRIAILHEGKLEQAGTREEVLNRPASEFVSELFSKPTKQLTAFKELI